LHAREVSEGRVILWDFDGTLGYRGPGAVRTGFTACLIEELDLHYPDHTVELADLRPHLASGFPWHDPDRPHPELCDAEAWWRNLMPVFVRALVNVGIAESDAVDMLPSVRSRFVDVRQWCLYEDVLPVLRHLAELGWRHVMVSNHVPELPDIVSALGLIPFFERVYSSAWTGYEKPHAEAFGIALRDAGSPSDVWMVGDSPNPDYDGPEALGIRSILVRHNEPGDRRSAADLWGAAKIIGSDTTAIDPRTSDG
jgi:HAD superfamily hydrolase (TIGR01549 family)